MNWLNLHNNLRMHIRNSTNSSSHEHRHHFSCDDSARRMIKRVRLAFTVAMAIMGPMLWSGAGALAAGMGAVTIKSLLGQPLAAEIELVTRDKRELESLSAQIASIDTHRRANIPYLGVTLGLRATIQTGKDGHNVIRVDSLKPVNETTLRLLIELSGPGTNAVREYAVLLEPPEMRER